MNQSFVGGKKRCNPWGWYGTLKGVALYVFTYSTPWRGVFPLLCIVTTVGQSCPVHNDLKQIEEETSGNVLCTSFWRILSAG